MLQLQGLFSIKCNGVKIYVRKYISYQYNAFFMVNFPHCLIFQMIAYCTWGWSMTEHVESVLFIGITTEVSDIQWDRSPIGCVWQPMLVCDQDIKIIGIVIFNWLSLLYILGSRCDVNIQSGQRSVEEWVRAGERRDNYGSMFYS